MEPLSIKEIILNPINKIAINGNEHLELESPAERKKTTPFIESNTKAITLNHLKQECTIPVFSKDNESTLAHQQFIETTLECVKEIFYNHKVLEPQIRASHVVKGRIPQAIGKPAKELLENEKTIYYERMMFVIEIPEITELVNGNELCLTIGGVRSYNQENLYSRKSFEKFKVFIGFKNLICCNLCVSSDGYVDDLRVSSTSELRNNIINLLRGFDTEKHLNQLSSLGNIFLKDTEVAHILGKARLYQHLDKSVKKIVPQLNLNDGQLSAVAKGFYEDENFKGNSNEISLWNFYNLMTGANKSSYIDSFLDRSKNSLDFTANIAKHYNDENYSNWFCLP